MWVGFGGFPFKIFNYWLGVKTQGKFHSLCTGWYKLYIARCDLEQWRDHFAQVNNTSFKLVLSVVDAVSEMAPDSSALFDECDDYLASVPIENEVREAVQCFKNKKPLVMMRLQQSCWSCMGEGRWWNIFLICSYDLSDLEVRNSSCRLAEKLAVPVQKGPTRDLDNYRGIALLSIWVKVSSRVIQVWLVERYEHVLSEDQCGFYNYVGVLIMTIDHFPTCTGKEVQRV